MKFMISVLLALLVAPALAMNNTDEAYLIGLNDGYHFGYLAMQGQKNATAEAEYNVKVAELNAWMDRVGYSGDRWANLVHAQNYMLPPIFSGARLSESEGANLQEPVAIGKNITSKGIVHTIDGSGQNASTWTTNDANALPDAVRLAYQAQDSKYNPDGSLKTGAATIGTGMGDGYLGGI